MCSASGEIHLFIIWENARNKQNEILDDIVEKFQVLDVLDVSWSDEFFSSNLTRFYGQKLPDRSFKEKHCGKGSFLLVVVCDVDPLYADRTTSRGVDHVNVHTFDCKDLYRSWTGGGHKIHATNNPDETRHDLVLLLGQAAKCYLNKEASPWCGAITYLSQDLVGAKSWKNLAEFFYVLNNTNKYVVMRNFSELPDDYVDELHGDIDLLTDDYSDLCHIANSSRVFRKSYRVHQTVMIAKRKVYFDFRYVGDGYYDATWQRNILASRNCHNNAVYVPNDENHFYSLFYHAAVHKTKIANDYVFKLIQMSSSMGEQVNIENLSDSSFLRNLLVKFLTNHGYVFTDPLDLSVYFNVAVAGRENLTSRRFVAIVVSHPIFQLKKVAKFFLRRDTRR